MPLRVPKLFNLRTDPFERADVTSNTYYDWMIDNAILVLTASAIVMRSSWRRSRSSRPGNPPPPSPSTRPSPSSRPRWPRASDDVGREDSLSAELDSWSDGPTKSAIIDFVARVSEEGGPDFVEPAARVAVFDNDGTLWCEKPMPIQLDFTVRRLGELARQDPTLQDRQPYKAAYENDLHWMGAAMVKHYQGDDTDLKLLMDAITSAFETVTVTEYDAQVKAFFAEASHPSLHKSYRDCGYLPDGGAAALSGRTRLRHLHRLRRRSGLHASGRR